MKLELMMYQSWFLCSVNRPQTEKRVISDKMFVHVMYLM